MALQLPPLVHPEVLRHTPSADHHETRNRNSMRLVVIGFSLLCLSMPRTGCPVPKPFHLCPLRPLLYICEERISLLCISSRPRPEATNLDREIRPTVEKQNQCFDRIKVRAPGGFSSKSRSPEKLCMTTKQGCDGRWYRHRRCRSMSELVVRKRPFV